MKNIIVLGAGMVGSSMAIDMAKAHQVTLTDVSKATLQKVQQKHPNINTKQLDVTDIKSLQSLIKQKILKTQHLEIK